MRRGIILEIQNEHWIVMTPDGSFEKVVNVNPYAKVGEEVELPIAEVVKPFTARKKWIVPVSGAVAALFATFFLISSFFTAKSYAAETYVYIDVNAGIKIGINKQQDVVSIVAIDQSDSNAQKLANRLNTKLQKDKQSIKGFTKQMIREAKQAGLIDSKDKVVISLFAKDENQLQLAKIKNEFTAETKSLQVDLAAVTLPATVEDEVKTSGLTPGKYVVWVLAKNAGQEIPLDELKNHSISEVAEKNKTIEDILASLPEQTEIKEVEPVVPEQKVSQPTEQPSTPTDQSVPQGSEEEIEQSPSNADDSSSGTTDSEPTTSNEPTAPSDDSDSTSGPSIDSSSSTTNTESNP